LAGFQKKNKTNLAITVSGLFLLALLCLCFEVNRGTGNTDNGFITIQVTLGCFIAVMGFLSQIIYFAMVAKVLKDRENHSKTVDDLRQ
jgi:hypothetical protein